jgi:hypothetical protein
MLVFYSYVHMLTVTLGLAESIELIKHACSALVPNGGQSTRSCELGFFGTHRASSPLSSTHSAVNPFSSAYFFERTVKACAFPNFY